MTLDPPGHDPLDDGQPGTKHQQFFARFVANKFLGYYYRRFTKKVRDDPENVVALGPDRDWREYYSHKSLAELKAIRSVMNPPHHTRRDQRTDPNLNIGSYTIKGLWVDVDIWDELYTDMHKRAFEDALTMAVPTASIDQADDDKRMVHLMNIGLFVLNMVLMVVPPAWWVMASAMAGQMMYEVLEGAVELSEGDQEAGWAHIVDVLNNAAQVWIGGALLPIATSEFMARLKPVVLPTGQTRLWKPNVDSYARSTPLPSGSVPDAQGLHTVNGSRVLPLEGRHFDVRPDTAPGRYRIQHPSRPGAYEPKVTSNGSGAWTHEAEQPLTWERPMLLRRLGPPVEGLSDEQLAQVRQISNIDESRLRRMYVENEPTPAALLDEVRRFRAYDAAKSVSAQIFAGQMSADQATYAASLIVDLPGWPEAKAIAVFRSNGGVSEVLGRYGNPRALEPDVIYISNDELINGQLPDKVVGALNETQLKGLLGQHLPEGNVLRSQRLQEQLGNFARNNHKRLFDSQYSDQRPVSEGVKLLQRDFKSLPTSQAQELLDNASRRDRASLLKNRKVPLDMAQQARQLAEQVRLSRAYEGLYLDTLANPDTEALVLNTLERLPGWKNNLRLEVREDSLSGPLRASHGEPTAGARKVLVRVEAGRYEAFDAEGNHLHGSDDLYSALLHALPDAHRAAIRLPHVGDGPKLRSLIRQRALSRSRLREVLKMRAQRVPVFKAPQRYGGDKLGYPLNSRPQLPEEPDYFSERVSLLYPWATAEDVGVFRALHFPEQAIWIARMEDQYLGLSNALEAWEHAPIEGFGPPESAEYQVQQEIRRQLAQVMRDAWRRVGDIDPLSVGDFRSQKIELNSYPVGPQLATLPALPADFSHVTYLEMAGAALGDDVDPILAHLPGLRFLDVAENNLTRIPMALERMPGLASLNLSENQIVLDAAGSDRLAQLTQLKRLHLDHNPLGMAPDISRMEQLHHVSLVNTGQTGWPIGIFAKPRPRWLNLDLEDNALQVPEVTPGSSEAQILAGTRVSAYRLQSEQLHRLKLYRESVGMDPQRTFPPRGMHDSAHWKTGLSDQQWADRQPMWDELEAPADAERFFDVIRSLSESLDDFGDSPAFKQDLTAKVWRMLEAMYDDAELRRGIFEIADRVDSSLELFNAMGLKVMVYETLGAPAGTLIGPPMLSLAKGTVRLDELGIIAQERVQALVAEGRTFAGDEEPGLDAAGNPLPEIDTEKIYQAYAVGLADRLDLPWQSRAPMFVVPDVTPQLLEEAFIRVNAMGDGNGLRNAMVELDFWARFVKDWNATDFAGVTLKRSALDRLNRAMATLAGNGGLPEFQKQVLRNVITRSTIELEKPLGTYVPETGLRADQYSTLKQGLDDEERLIIAGLTDLALAPPPIAEG